MVSVASTAVASAHRVPTRARRALARRPDVWVFALAAVGGVALVLVHLTRHDHATQVHTFGHGHAETTPSLLGSWTGWMLMVLAMMLPVIAPQARQVALRSLWSQRHRAMAGYLAGYLIVWAALGITVLAALHGAGVADPPATVLVAALLVAAGWQTSRPRRQMLRRCGVLRLGAPRGWAAARDCATLGLRAGLRCVLTCGPAMVAMAMATHHNLILMAGLLVLMLTERARGPNPTRRAGRPLEAWCLAGLAAIAGITTAI
jgi:predicted metal-binding membrane protein